MIKAIQPPALRRTPKGFTLIELLVVIAIIALLAAILFPVFARARENARKSSCANNLKQIAIGVAQYTQDYDESYPWAWGGVSGQNACWWQLLVPYIKSQQVFSCPSDSNKTNGGNGFASAGLAQGYPSGAFHISYGVNYPLFGNGSNASTMAFNLSDMPKPAQVVMMSDAGVTAAAASPWVTTNIGSKGSAWLLADPTCANNNAAKPCNSGAAGSVASAGDTNWSAAYARHLETVNTAYADGHVKATRAEFWYYNDSNWMNPRVGGP